jgi:hypothetical protein
VRRDLLLIDNPVECFRRAIGSIGGEIGGLDVEALLLIEAGGAGVFLVQVFDDLQTETTA